MEEDSLFEEDSTVQMVIFLIMVNKKQGRVIHQRAKRGAEAAEG
jgi:hypothetical protein